MSSIPPCEECGREPATSFSWFMDPARRYASASGTWKFTGDCTADTETYYVMLHHPRGGLGFLDSQREQDDWWRHLEGKVWFNPLDFARALDRFVAAGGDLTPGRKRRRRSLRPFV